MHYASYIVTIIHMTNKDKRSNCPISSALDTVGDKWSLLIVRDLLFTNKKTYSDFLKSEEGIATNILASRLTTLENAKIIKKYPNQKDGRKDFYKLTKKGSDLIPILIEFTLWSAKYDKDIVISKEIVNRAKKIKVALLKNKK